MGASTMIHAAPALAPGEAFRETSSDPPGSGGFPLSVEQVVHDYAPRVYHMARRMVSNEVDAEDVAQDVLLQVVRKLPTFRGDAALPTWLHRVTVNTALSHRRRQAVRAGHAAPGPRQAAGVEDATPPALPGRSPGPEAQALSQETSQLIDQAVQGLPETYREVFLLADVENWSNADIAARLGLSLPAVKSRLHRARQLLREALAPHFDYPG